jgi:hypothetical protein
MKGNIPMKKSIVIALILILAGVLVACTAIAGQNGALSGAPNGEAPSGAGGPGGRQGGAPGQAPSGSSTAQAESLPIDSVAGIGIIKLEGTDNAIDKDTASNLLPLFKALKALSTNSNTSVAEITALNKQIKNTLTADQITAIENLKITSTDVNKLLKENGLTATTSSTSSSSASNRENGGMGGPPDGGGMMMMAAGNTSSSKTQATPNAVAALATSRKSAGGNNLTFADIIIKILEAKVAK